MKVDFKDLVRLTNVYDTDDYRFIDGYCDLVAKELSKELGTEVDYYEGYFYLSGNRGEKVYHRGLDKEDIKRELKQILNGLGGVSNANLIARYAYRFTNYRFEDRKGTIKKYSDKPYLYEVLDFLLYAFTGNANDDLRQARDLEDKARDYWKSTNNMDSAMLSDWDINYGTWLDFGKVIDPMFDGITVKFFQNGKIVIKGLSDDEWNRLVDLQEICLSSKNTYY